MKKLIGNSIQTKTNFPFTKKKTFFVYYAYVQSISNAAINELFCSPLLVVFTLQVLTKVNDSAQLNMHCYHLQRCYIYSLYNVN